MLGKATKKDHDYVMKVIKKLKMENSTMHFPNLGKLDTGYKNLPDAYLVVEDL